MYHNSFEDNIVKLIKALDYFDCPKDMESVCKTLVQQMSKASDQALMKIHQDIQRIW